MTPGAVLGLLAGPLLAVYALVLVAPGPRWVRRWEFLYDVPRPAMVLWQAGTVAALMATVGAGAVTAWQLAGSGWEHPLLAVSMVLCLLLALSVVVRLPWGVVSTLRQTAVRRARHRRSLDLLARVEVAGTGLGALGTQAGGVDLSRVRVLAEAIPMAWCLPGVRGPRLVVTTGTLAHLAADELAAVLAHERGHLRARHDVVLDWFASLHRAFPHLVRSDVALAEGRFLVELLADDAARRRVGAQPLARALVQMAGTPVPAHALGAGDLGTLRRVRRLAGLRPRPVLTAGLYALAGALVAAPVGVLVLLPLL